jgi:hypothetical protein
VTAAKIARALGGRRGSGGWWSCCCPAHDDRIPSLSVRDGNCAGVIVRCHAGCTPRDVLEGLRRLGLIGGQSGVTEPEPRARYQPPLRIDPDDAARRIALARRIWDAALDACESPVARYLSARGIITLPMPPVLRWAASLRRPDSTHAPAMVARIDGPDGEMVGVHRTWLTRGAAIGRAGSSIGRSHDPGRPWPEHFRRQLRGPAAMQPQHPHIRLGPQIALGHLGRRVSDMADRVRTVRRRHRPSR